MEQKEKSRIKEEIDKWKLIRRLSIIAILILFITTLVFVVRLMIIAKSMNLDEFVITLMWSLSIGWFIAIILLPVTFIARSEIFQKLQYYGRRSKRAIFRMIGSDGNENEVIVKLQGNIIDMKESKLIVNPRRATVKNGVKVFTYVAGNSITHDYYINKTETLKEIAKRLDEKKEDEMHDVFTDPIRIDAKLFSETFLTAQQTNPDIIKKIIAFLTSKNVLTFLLLILIASAAAAVLSLQNSNLLNEIAAQIGVVSP